MALDEQSGRIVVAKVPACFQFALKMDVPETMDATL
jgi:hypothetical protein